MGVYIDLDHHRRIIKTREGDKGKICKQAGEYPQMLLIHPSYLPIADLAHLRVVALLVAGVAALVVTLEEWLITTDVQIGLDRSSIPCGGPPGASSWCGC